VIFTSSTAIYPATNKVCSESDSIPYFSERYHVLKTVESLVLQHPLSIVLRLGGLYGPGREAKLFGQKKLFHEKERVNLIHQSHAKILIEKIIKKRLSGIYNVVSSFHPTKKEFYKEQEKNIKNNLNQNFIEKNNPLNINQNLIQSENLVVPIVKKSDTSEGNYKIISNEKLLKALNLTKNFFKK
jgi:nucleoside-diphosphate-sugar epimerase